MENENTPYASYPQGYKKLVKDLKMPFYYRFMTDKIMKLFIKVLIDG